VDGSCRISRSIIWVGPTYQEEEDQREENHYENNLRQNPSLSARQGPDEPDEHKNQAPEASQEDCNGNP